MSEDEPPQEARRLIRCAIYIRVSTEEQAKPGHYSLDAQTAKCLETIRTHKHEGWVHKITLSDPGYTGGNTDRPGFLRLYGMVKNGEIDCVVAYRRDRLFRNLDVGSQFQSACDSRGVIVCSTEEGISDQSPDGVYRRQNTDSRAQLERSYGALRVRDAILHGAKQGDWKGGIAPFGYSYQHGTKVLSVNEAEAVVIRTIFDKLAAGVPVAEVVLSLRSGGITSRKSKETDESGMPRETYFTVAHIRRMVSNVNYRGLVRARGRAELPGVITWSEFRGRHVPLVSDETWFAANRNLGTPQSEKYARKVPRDSEDSGLLTTIAHCACCRCAMVQAAAAKRKRNGDRHLYYRCSQLMKSAEKSRCTTRQVTIGAADRAVLALLGMVSDTNDLQRFGFINANRARAQQQADKRAELFKIDAILSEKRKNISNVINFIRENDGSKLTPEAIADAEKTKKELEDLEFKRLQIDGDLHRLAAKTPDASAVVEAIKTLVRRLSISDRRNQRLILRSVLRKVAFRRIYLPAKSRKRAAPRAFRISVMFNSAALLESCRPPNEIALVRLSDFEISVSFEVFSNSSLQRLLLLEPNITLVVENYIKIAASEPASMQENPIQRALRWQNILSKDGIKKQALARQECVSPALVSQHLKLLGLPQLIVDFMRKGAPTTPPITMRELLRMLVMPHTEAVEAFHTRVSGAPVQGVLGLLTTRTTSSSL